MKQALLPIILFAVLAFALSWLANEFMPPMTWQHVDFREIATGLGPALSGLICYLTFRLPNTYRLSLAGPKPLLIYGITLIGIITPILLDRHGDKSLLIGSVFTQFAYTLGEELGWRHYLQNATSQFSSWVQALLIGVIWFFWHYSILPDPTTMLNGHAIPFYIGIPLMLLLLVLLSKLLGNVVLRTHAVLLPTLIHYIGKVGSGYTLIIVYGLIVIVYFTWNKINVRSQTPV